MRTTRLVAVWSAIVFVSGLGAGCATGNGARYASDGLASPTPEERRAMRDSARAQEVADEVGPRVSVRADFDYSAGSRRVQATFHMYDDAYVIVGHLDAAGRLEVVFPNQPGDDGFVRGDQIYQVPPFFAGFGDEYRWRYSNYRYQAHNSASRYDSYDAGIGYVFVIASWRPMRLDRITNGNKWESYEVSDISYMSDPREAVDELASLIAGDNREAYSIEYAHYTTTNYGTYAYSDFDRLNSTCADEMWGSSLYNTGFFYSPVYFSPFGGFGFDATGCGGANRYYYYSAFPYGSYTAYTPYAPAPVIPRRPQIPIGSPIFHLPRNVGEGVALHRPQTAGTTVGSGQYRRPGLIAEDAAGPRRPGERTFDNGATIGTRRPTIQDMVGSGHIEEGTRGFSARGNGISPDNGAAWRSPRGTSQSTGTYRGVEGASRWNGGSRVSGGETARPSNGGQRTYGGQTSYSPASHAGGTHSSPAASSHGGETRSAPSAAPAHSSPPPASSSSGSKKP